MTEEKGCWISGDSSLSLMGKIEMNLSKRLSFNAYSMIQFNAESSLSIIWEIIDNHV